MNRITIFILIFVFAPVSQAEQLDSIKLWNRNYEKSYLLEVVELALTLTEAEYGKFEIAPSVALEQGRVFAELNTGTLVSLAITGINKEREAKFNPILIPVDKGLLGFRICLVNNSRISFLNINVLKDFARQNIVLGVGAHWPDKQIYEANGLRVLSSPLYENLFEMLEKRRFDCLPRSISELDYEIKAHDKHNFSAEREIALVYPNADFIYVSQATPRLRERLKSGITRAIESGEFSLLFNRYYADVMQKFNFYGRKLLILENPNLSPEARQAINRYGIASFLNFSTD